MAVFPRFASLLSPLSCFEVGLFMSSVGFVIICNYCFDTVGWVSGRASDV